MTETEKMKDFLLNFFRFLKEKMQFRFPAKNTLIFIRKWNAPRDAAAWGKRACVR
jgi:hypothetical protein